MSDVQLPDHWQATDGKWYPPSAATTPAVAVVAAAPSSQGSTAIGAFVGWVVMIASVVLGISTLVELGDTGFDVGFHQYMAALATPFTMLALGAIAVGVAHIEDKR